MHRYLSRFPRKQYPEGVILVHNHVVAPRPEAQCGENGFRYWVTDENLDRYQVCKCHFAPGRVHYRVKTKA